MIAREAEKESVYYEKADQDQDNLGPEPEQQDVASSCPQPAWAAAAAGTMHMGAQSWDFGVNISSEAPPTPGYVSARPRRVSFRLSAHTQPQLTVILVASQGAQGGHTFMAAELATEWPVSQQSAPEPGSVSYAAGGSCCGQPAAMGGNRRDSAGANGRHSAVPCM